jgi:hypothetical protein
VVGTGGVTGTGGGGGTGGVTATGGTGGAGGAGGVKGSGGVTGTGGVAATGGVTGTGGVTATGGVTGTGGVTATGGITGTGGVTATGGITGTGGTIVTGTNQILNGDFSNGATYWGVTINSSGTVSGVSSSVSNGQLCVSIPTYVSVTIGWPATGSPVAVLHQGKTYYFSYQISTTATLYTYEAKIGQATSPYTQTDLSITSDAPVAGAGLQTFSYQFIAVYDEPVAGVAFNILTLSPTTVCVDNVSLIEPAQ